jgi:hypothetical protein
LKVVETNQLRCVILDFENKQGKRVETILQQHENASNRVDEARRAKTSNALKKGMLIVEEYNFMKWEVDTDVGDVNQSKDEFDGGEHLRAAIEFPLLTRLLQAIEKAEEELDELSDKFTYEAMIHNTLAVGMQEFIAGAGLPKHEAALWVPKNSDNDKHKAFRPIEKSELKKLKREAFAWMRAASIHFMKLEEQQAGLGQGTALIGSGRGTHDEGVAAEVQGGESAHAPDLGGAFPKSQNDWAPKFCTFCNKWGHADQYCPEMFPEEDQPNYCDVCDKEGHMEETCWILHPELRDQWLAEQKAKQKKMTCHQCGKVGHMRRFCHLLHH